MYFACKATSMIVISFLKGPCVEPTYTFLTFLQTLLSIDSLTYTSNFYTIH